MGHELQPHAPLGSHVSIKVVADNALAVVKKVLEFGPQTAEFTAHLQNGMVEFLAAKEMVAKHFGFAADAGDDQVTWDKLCEAQPELREKYQELWRLAGNSGKFFDMLTLMLSNPAMLSMLMGWFKLMVKTP